MYPWAVACPSHYSHAAGLVLVHPQHAWRTDHEQAIIDWLKREAYQRFDYDPEGCFGQTLTVTGCGDPSCHAEVPHFG